MRKKKPINVEIGKQIHNARVERGITQEQLAEALEMSPQYISSVERGASGISLSALKCICNALSVSSDQILFGKPSQTIQPIVEQFADLNESSIHAISSILISIKELMENNQQ